MGGRRASYRLVRAPAVALLLALTAGCASPSQPAPMSTFPTPTAQLSAAQQRFLQVARAEFEAQPPGTKYSGGPQEPWCADFVTWVAKESGAPLRNPHSRSWRIPGVDTLAEAYQAAGRWRAPDSGYTPQVGDVVLYAPDSPFGHHTNYVLDYTDGQLTTIGGNEDGRIRITRHRLGAALKVAGFGVRHERAHD